MGWANILFPSINIPFVEDDVLNWFCRAWAVISAAGAATTTAFFTSSNGIDGPLMISGDDVVTFNALSIDCSTRV